RRSLRLPKLCPVVAHRLHRVRIRSASMVAPIQPRLSRWTPAAGRRLAGDVDGERFWTGFEKLSTSRKPKIVTFEGRNAHCNALAGADGRGGISRPRL